MKNNKQKEEEEEESKVENKTMLIKLLHQWNSKMFEKNNFSYISQEIQSNQNIKIQSIIAQQQECYVVVEVNRYCFDMI